MSVYWRTHYLGNAPLFEIGYSLRLSTPKYMELLHKLTSRGYAF